MGGGAQDSYARYQKKKWGEGRKIHVLGIKKRNGGGAQDSYARHRAQF